MYPSSQQQRGRFHSLMQTARDMVLVFLSAQVNELFGSTDDALLDFAERAESNAMQGRFFEAIGSVRRHRSEIEQRFREQVHEGFDRFGSARPEIPGPAAELRLVERDDMEESVAAENLAIRCRANYYGELYALGQRLAVLNQGRKVPEEEIPGGPTQLVEAFRFAISDLTVDVKAKIVLYALFEKFVLRQLKGLYDELNNNLKNAGVLPNLKPVISKSQSARQPYAESRVPPQANPEAGAASGGELSDEAARESLGEELFDSILHLLATRRVQSSPGRGGTRAAGVPTAAGTGTAQSGQPAPPGGQTPGPEGAASGGAGPAPGQTHQRLLTAIDNVRPTAVGHGKGVLSDLESLPQVAVDPEFLGKLKSTLAHERELILSQVSREQLQGVDVDTIDLIGMLFEYMLNDPLLPNLAKALLSHLHTPYLKLSLVERQLLVDSEHPARLLLDLLVEAGGQWVYENDIKRGIFPRMQTVVDRVLQEATEKPEVFRDLLEFFKAAVDEQRRRSSAIEQRAQESVQGREKLQVAKQRAAQEMKARMGQAPLPRPARRFLTQAWTDRLVFLLLRHPEGEMSEDWTQALRVADDLVWLFDPQASQADAEAIERTCRSVSAEIDNALDSLGGYHQHYLDELRRVLRQPEAIAAWHAENAAAPFAEPLYADPESLPETSAPAPAAQTAPEEQPEEAAPPLETLSAAEQAMLETLKQLKFGTWFEFSGVQGMRRLKLSWLSPLTSTCMFVDRSGIQAEVEPLVDIARDLAAGRVKIIPRPRHQFVQRALLAIRQRLQRSMEATS
jgi:hypothetical protein